MSKRIVSAAAPGAVCLALAWSWAARPADPLARAERRQAATVENVQVSRDGAVAGASLPVTDFSEVMLAADPTDPDHLLGCAKLFHTPAAYRFHSGVFESFDGGRSWSQRQPDGVEGYTLTSDPVAAFDHAGNAYFAVLTRGPTGIDVLKKPFGGGWGPPVTADRTTAADKQWIAADHDPRGASPHSGNVYLAWTDVGDPARIVFARSTDSGAAWSAPLVLATGPLQGAVPAVGPDGTVVVVYGRDIIAVGDGDGAIEWVRSTDGGRTFSAPATAAALRAVPYQLPNAVFRTPASLPALAISPTTGDIHVAWADYRHGDADILAVRSTDGGATWSTPRRLNDDAVAGGVDQFQPQLAAAPNGRIAAVWFDRRLPCPDLPWIPRENVGRANFCIDTYMARSHDGGATWEPNVRVSAQTWDWSISLPMVNPTTGFIGDYQGLASTADADIAFWNATADLGDNPRRRQQVFVARVPAGRPTAEATATAAPRGSVYLPVAGGSEGTASGAAPVRLRDARRSVMLPRGGATGPPTVHGSPRRLP